MISTLCADEFHSGGKSFHVGGLQEANNWGVTGVPREICWSLRSSVANGISDINSRRSANVKFFVPRSSSDGHQCFSKAAREVVNLKFRYDGKHNQAAGCPSIPLPRAHTTKLGVQTFNSRPVGGIGLRCRPKSINFSPMPQDRGRISHIRPTPQLRTLQALGVLERGSKQKFVGGLVRLTITLPTWGLPMSYMRVAEPARNAAAAGPGWGSDPGVSRREQDSP